MVGDDLINDIWGQKYGIEPSFLVKIANLDLLYIKNLP